MSFIFCDDNDDVDDDNSNNDNDDDDDISIRMTIFIRLVIFCWFLKFYFGTNQEAGAGWNDGILD